jgi:hypothetical protein
MLNHLANIKKLFLIGIAVASSKIVLLLFAYFFDAETYNKFNQVYYTASMVILFGSLGFNIAITRIKLRMKWVIVTVIFTTLVSYIFLQIISSPFENTFQIISILIYCLFSSLGGIYVFQVLFSGRYTDYVLLTLIYSFLHLLIIPSMLLLKLDLFNVLPLVSFLWFIIGLPKFVHPDENSNVKEFLKIGASAFIINSAVSLALAADKYFVNHFFSTDIANSYTFAWGISAPMFYIGVLIEQYLFSETNANKSNILKKGFILSTSLVIIYAIGVLSAVHFFPDLIPQSVDYEAVLKISVLMISGYSVYVIFHFPVNAYLFKSLSTGKQKTISIAFSIIISVYLVIYILILQEIISINYIWLLIITWSYIFTLLTTKILIMFREEIDKEPAKSFVEIKNFEP